MKKFKSIYLMILMAVAFVSMNAAPVTADDSDQSCTVTVRYKNGALAKGVTVTTSVSGGISCLGGRDFKTGAEGAVTLKWVKGCYLKKVFVKGDTYEVDYKDGKTYTLTLTVNG
jgi:hypothetical protein